MSLDLRNPSQAPVAPAVPFSDIVRKQISRIMNGKRGEDFVVSAVSLLNDNADLKKCDPISVVSACLKAQSVGLLFDKNFGQAYVIPFKDNKNNRTVATLQIGYRGYIQLAIRSGAYKKLNVLEIKQGELINFDPLNEDIEVQLVDDWNERDKLPTIGYYAMFEYTNGFRKALYWTREKMDAHAKTYSQSYRNGYKSFWKTDFDAMAKKTMLRQLISKWGIVSVEMQNAMSSDMRVINAEGNPDSDIVDVDFMEQTAPTEVKAEVAIEAEVVEAKDEKPTPPVQKVAKANTKPTPPVSPSPKKPMPPQQPEATNPRVDKNTGEVASDVYTVACPNKGGAAVDEIDCANCPSRQGCPAWE